MAATPLPFFVYDESMEQTLHVKRRGRIGWIIAAVIAVIALVGAGVWFFTRPPTSLLPPEVAHKLSGYHLYFYTDKIPAGYTMDPASITAEHNILIVPFTRDDGSRIVLTEQAMPAGMSGEDVQQNGTAVRDTVGKSSINEVEGRMVGTMLSPDRKTLVLFNAPGNTNKDDLTALLQALRQF
jgi:hypothetical protein